MGDAGIVARVGGPEPGALAVVVLGHRRREAVAGAGEIRTIEHRLTRHEQRFHHDARVVEPAGELHPLGGQVHAQPEIAAHGVPLPDAQHEREQLRRLPDPLAQLARPAEDRADFGRGIAARRDVGGTQRAQQLELAGVSLGGFVERFEQLQAPGQVADRLDLRRPLPRPQPRLEPVADRLLGQARFGEVVGEQLRLGRDGLRETAPPSPRRFAGGTAGACP